MAGSFLIQFFNSNIQWLLTLMVISLDLQPIDEKNILDFVDHSCSIQVKFSSNQDIGMSVKVS